MKFIADYQVGDLIVFRNDRTKPLRVLSKSDKLDAEYVHSGGIREIYDPTYIRPYEPNNNKYQVGDKILLLDGTQPLVVTLVDNSTSSLYARVENDKWGGPHFLYFHEVKPYDEPNNKSIMNTNTLYSFFDVDGVQRFATVLAKNSAGQYVLEVKGTNEIVVRSPDLLTEVVPHTVKVGFWDEWMTFEVEEGLLRPGDVVAYKNTIGVVEAVDTKSKNGLSAKGLRKVLTEPLA